MGKRQPKPEPFSVAELEEIAQSPALQGFETVLHYRPVLIHPPPSTVEPRKTSTVEVETATTVEDDLSSTVVAEPPSTMAARPVSTVEGISSATAVFHAPGQTFWTAEGAGGVFTSSRIKKIERAQDALTHVEEAVYDALWGPKRTAAPEPFRLSQIGYSELAKRSRVSKRSIQSVIDRLVEKRFIEIDTAADITTRKPTIYRVLGYAAVLKFLRDSGRTFVVRTGRGVFYAHRLSGHTMEAGTSSTVEAETASTVEARSPSTVEATAPSTVEASSTGNTLGNYRRGTTSSSVSSVASKIVPLLAIDDDAVSRLISNCRQADQTASDEEIAWCAELWIRENARNTSIRKPVAVMLAAVPKFFEPPATEISRYRAEQTRLAEQSREAARLILDDPSSSPEAILWARSVLADEKCP